MNSIRYCLSTLTAIVCSVLLYATCISCQRHDAYPQSLILADSLASVNPDSALCLLSRDSAEICRGSERNRYFYNLLTIKARDKAFLPHASDSLILSVLSYYETKKDPKLLPVAYYYAGRVTSDLGDAPTALVYFQKALEAKPEPRQVSTIYAQMGYLFRAQHLYNDALSCFKTAASLDESAKDTVRFIYNLIDIGQILNSQDYKKEALSYYNRAESLAIITHDTANLCKSIRQQVFLLLTMRRQAEAEQLFGQMPPVPQSRYHQRMNNVLKAYIYANSSHKDSACYYNRLLLTNGDLYQKAQANIWLANYLLKEKKPQEAIEHLKDQIIFNDSLSKIKETETLGLVNSLYNYQKKEKERQKLQIEKEQYLRYTITAILLSILFAILLLNAFLYYNRYRKETQKQQKNLQLLYQQKEQENEYATTQYSQKISLLKSQLGEANSQNEHIQQQLDELLLLKQRFEVEKQLETSFYARWLSSASHELITEKIKLDKPLLNADWDVIESDIQRLAPTFLSKLQSIYNFSEIEWQVSLLLKLQVNPSKIADLVCRKTTTISSIRQRLYQKVKGEKGAASDWDSFISNL